MFILLNIALFVTLAFAEIPSYIKVCGRKDPKLDQCILNSVESLQGKLKSGMPELNVPPLEPMLLDRVVLADIPNLQASARDVKLHGLSDFKVDSLKMDLKNKQINVDITFKEVILDADYDVKAKILVPVAGTGPINIVARDVKAKVVMNYKIIDRNGKQYMFFSAMTTKLSIEDYTSNFTPSEGPDKTLSTAINAALQNSRQEIIESTTPHLEQKITEEILQIANKICKNFTYSELFPERE